MRWVIYRRVSTDEQADSGAGLDAQLDACRALAERLDPSPHRLILGPYDDAGLSGAAALDRRPGLLDALAQLGRGDALVVAKRDRLGRDPIVVAMIEAAAVRSGARVVSAAGEGTDNDDPASILLRRIVDAFAEYERLLIKARTRAALTAKRRRGERTGTVPYGSHLTPDGRIAPDPTELATIERLAILRRAGASYRQLARLLESEGHRPRSGRAWSTATLSRLLNRDRDRGPHAEPQAQAQAPIDPT
jgi:DNA invertase Pin-like site-specific DNA recombinase